MNRNKNCQVKMADGKLMKSKHDQIDRQSKRLLTTLTPVHWSQPRPLSWTFKSPIIATSPFNHYLLFILSLLLLLLSTTTTLTAGHEAKNDWSTGHHHHHSSSSVSAVAAAVAAASASSSSISVARPRYRTLYACEGSSLEILCDEGTHINLIRANFGRFSISVCNEHGNVEWSVDCMSHRSFRVIQERCSGRSKCNIEASVATFGEDACPRVHKYLEVHFNCTLPRASIISPNSASIMNQTDNHSHHEQSNIGAHHNRHNSPVTLSPVIIFPEPLAPSSEEQKSVSTSTPIPPPRFVDLTPFDTKEAEEAVGAGAVSPMSAHFPDGPIVVRPPHPNDFVTSDDEEENVDSDDDNEDSDDGAGSEDMRPVNHFFHITSTVPSHELPKQQHTNMHPHQHQHEPTLQQRPHHSFQHPSEPTAKPPKPHQFESELPSAEDGRMSFTSSSVNHHQHHSTNADTNNNNEMVIEEEEEVVVQPVMPSLDLVYDHCHPMYAKGLNWNWTTAGGVSRQSCPAGAKGTARWSCIMEGGVPTWTPHLPDMSNCSSLWVAHLLERIRSHHDSVFSLAEELAKGAKGKILYSGDLISAADIIKQLVTRLESKLEESKDDQERRAYLIKELLNSVLNVASNLLEEIQMESWHELNPHDQRAAIKTMTRALERVAQLLADVRSQPNYKYVLTHNNILVSVHVEALAALRHGLRLPLVLTQPESHGHSMSDLAPNEVSAFLPYDALVDHANDNGQVKVIFLMYKRLASLLKVRTPPYTTTPSHLQPYVYKHYTPERNAEYDLSAYHRSHNEDLPHVIYRSQQMTTIVNSDIVGLIIASDMHHVSYDRLPTQLSAPLELTLRHLQTENVTNGRCAFWDIKRSNDDDIDGDWSTAGCKTVSTNRTHTVCRCNHLTNFAVLMDITNTPFDATDEYALKLITRIGCAISIVALVLTLLTLSLYRSLKSIRNSIHKNLCACLLIAELIFLLGIDETRVKLICGLIAIALHYFFLAAFLWMFFEGLQLYTMLVQVFEHRHNRLTVYTLVAYGAPALLVIVAALVDPLSYGTTDHCWLRADNHFVWSFLGPALAVLLANALFLALAMGVMCRHSSSGMMSTTSFAVHQKQQQQQQLKVYPSPLTSSPSYSISDHSKMASIRVWVRTSFALVVVLGLTWTFGVLYLSRSTVYMAYIFTLLNSLQGLFIFIFCCLLNEKVRAEYRTTLARGARRCFLLRPLEPSSLAFGTKSSTDSTRSTSLRDSHHLMMNGAAAHHLSQQHLYMQQPAASFLGSRNAGPRTSLLYLNELLGKSDTPTAVSTPTADQPLITSQMMQQTANGQSSQHQSQNNLDQHLQQTQLSQALNNLSQITLPDDASTSDYGCRRLTQMIEHIYECIDEDPYVAKLLLPAIQRSLGNHQARTLVRNNMPQELPRNQALSPSILATLGRASQRDVAQHMRLQPNSSYLSSGNPHHTIHGGLHLPAIVRDNTSSKMNMPQLAQQQSVALLDGDQVRCLTLNDTGKHCDPGTPQQSQQQPELNSQAALHMMNALKANGRHHLASEC